jgi:hypothetical protein
VLCRLSVTDSYWLANLPTSAYRTQVCACACAKIRRLTAVHSDSGCTSVSPLFNSRYRSLHCPGLLQPPQTPVKSNSCVLCRARTQTLQRRHRSSAENNKLKGVAPPAAAPSPQRKSRSKRSTPRRRRGRDTYTGKCLVRASPST